MRVRVGKDQIDVALSGMFSRRSSDRGTRGGSGAPDAERLALLDEFEESGLGWFWASDTEGLLRYLSASAAKQLGMPIEDLIDKPLTSLFLPDNAEDDDRAERPLAFQLRARGSIADLAVRVTADGVER